jgi:MFS family permease
MSNTVQAVAAPVTRPARQGGARHRGLALGLILLAQLLVVIDVSIVTLALPTIGRALGFSATGLQWVISAYALAFGGSSYAGWDAVAIGHNAFAWENSVALGRNATAGHSNSITDGSEAIAIGYNATGMARDSIAIGRGATSGTYIGTDRKSVV